MLIGAVAVLIAGYHTFMHIVNKPYLSSAPADIQYQQMSFTFAFIIGSLIWCGHAFPFFRTKEKSISYLMVPTTTFEKFLFEFTNRIILYIVCFPIIYWVFTNLVAGIYHLIHPTYINYKFSYVNIIPGFNNVELALIFSIGFLILSLSFAGATYFQKLPLIKTVILVAAILGGFVLFGVLIFKVFSVGQYTIAKGDKLLFMKDAEAAKAAAVVAAIIANIVILAIGYFKIKEKEV